MFVKPTDETVKTLLMGPKHFSIPRFQRAYSWDKANVEEFWSDAVTTSDSDYFIGSFVVYQDPSDDDHLFIVDGQQRMTTITILLAALRDVLGACDELKLAEGVQSLIQKQNDAAELEYVLTPETSHPYFQDVVQRHGAPKYSHELKTEEQAIKEAYDYFREQLEEIVEAIDDQDEIEAAANAEKKREALGGIRKAILRLRVILVTLMNEDDAYLVFETLNTRGKDLGVGDLVKNHITRVLKPEATSLDEAKDRWNDVRRRVEGQGKSSDFDAFLHYSWMSREGYIQRAKLYRLVKEVVPDPDAASAYLDELEVDFEAYSRVIRPDGKSWDSGHGRIQEGLRELSRYGVRQPLPFLMALIRGYSDDELTKRQAEIMLVSLEHFHAAFTGVASKRTGGGTAAMYAASARDLASANDKNARSRVLTAFRKKLRERMPSADEFDAAARQLLFLDDETRDKAVLRYLLRRLDQHLQPKHKSPPDYGKYSIEHILPQSKASDDEARSFVGSLGNLILVPETLNSNDLQAKPFKQKKALLEKAGVPLDGVLGGAGTWTFKKIDSRGKAIAALLYDSVLKV